MSDKNPPAPPRTRRREKNRQRILDEAMEQVVQSGFGGLSLHKLAARLDYTPGALYRYFANKDALVSALVDEVLRDVQQDLSEAAAECSDPLACIRAYTEAWYAFSAAHPQRFALITLMLAEPRVVLQDPDVAAAAASQLITALRPLIQALEEAAAQGRLSPGDPVQRASLLFAGTQGVLLLKKQATRIPTLLQVQTLFPAMVESLLAGWASAPKAAWRNP